MNNSRRKEIEAMIRSVEIAKAEFLKINFSNIGAEDLPSDIEQIMSDEQDYFDCMPESLQGGDKGQAAEAAIEALEEAINLAGEISTVIEDLKDLESKFDEIITALDNAKQ